MNDPHHPNESQENERANEQPQATAEQRHGGVADADAPEHQPEHAPAQVAPFDPRRLRREVWLDALIRWSMVLAVAVVLVVVLAVGGDGDGALLAALLVMAGGWAGLNMLSATVSRELPQLTLMADADPAAAEDRLAHYLRRKSLLRWVRLALYHRLAIIRHHQQRFAESAAIARAVLSYDLGPAKDARYHLLLLLTEGSLERHDLLTAWHALNELHQCPLSLTQSLQRLALRTRYELMAGYHDAVVYTAQHQIQRLELLPAPQCGAVHAMLATAAERARRPELAQWLWNRAQLLCTPEQLEQLRAGQGVGMVAAAPVYFAQK